MIDKDQLSLFGALPVPTEGKLVVASPVPVVTGEVIERETLPARQGEQFEQQTKFPAEIPIDVVGDLTHLGFHARVSKVFGTHRFCYAWVTIVVGKEEHKLSVDLVASRAKQLLSRKLGKRVRVRGIAVVEKPTSRFHSMKNGKIEPVQRKKKGAKRG